MLQKNFFYYQVSPTEGPLRYLISTRLHRTLLWEPFSKLSISGSPPETKQPITRQSVQYFIEMNVPFMPMVPGETSTPQWSRTPLGVALVAPGCREAQMAAILQLSQYCTFTRDSISTVITEPGQPGSHWPLRGTAESSVSPKPRLTPQVKASGALTHKWLCS